MDFGLIDFHDALQRLALRIDHRPPQFLRQQPSGLVGDAELRLDLERRHAVGVGRHQVRGPEPYRQRQLRAVHHGAGRDRSLTTAAEALAGGRAAPQQRRAAVAASGDTKPSGQRRSNRNASQLASSGKPA